MSNLLAPRSVDISKPNKNLYGRRSGCRWREFRFQGNLFLLLLSFFFLFSSAYDRYTLIQRSTQTMRARGIICSVLYRPVCCVATGLMVLIELVEIKKLRVYILGMGKSTGTGRYLYWYRYRQMLVPVHP